MAERTERTYYETTYESPIGTIFLSSDGTSITGLWFEDQKYFKYSVRNSEAVAAKLPVFVKTKKWLTRYFNGREPKISELPLNPKGTEFQKTVWELLCEIPYGQTTTYGQLSNKVAERMGKKSMAAQAVGQAVGHNPISIIIPCHRVMGTDGSFTGYAGGINRKYFLLGIEGEVLKLAEIMQ